jgi:hypothetical protein
MVFPPFRLHMSFSSSSELTSCDCFISYSEAESLLSYHPFSPYSSTIRSLLTFLTCWVLILSSSLSLSFTTPYIFIAPFLFQENFSSSLTCTENFSFASSSKIFVVIRSGTLFKRLYDVRSEKTIKFDFLTLTYWYIFLLVACLWGHGSSYWRTYLVVDKVEVVLHEQSILEHLDQGGL